MSVKPIQPGPLPMILRRIRPAILSHRLETHTHLHVSPHLNFAVAGAPESGSSRIERMFSGNAGERILRREEYTRRIIDRGSRREAGAAIERTEEAFRTAPLTRVPSVLLRTQPAAPAAVATSNTPPLGSRPWTPPAAPQTPPVDVQRLTEQVIQQIDRRLQSYKERTGRR